MRWGTEQKDEAQEGMGSEFKVHRPPALYKGTLNLKDMKSIFSNKDFWKDALLFLGVLCLFYIIYVVVEYWPNIVEGFNRGWSGE